MLNAKLLMSLFVAIAIGLLGVQVEAQAVDHDDRDKDKDKEISGVVVDAATGEALSGIEIKLEENGESAETNEEGEFTLENLEPGSYTLIVEQEGYEEWSQTVEVGDEREDEEFMEEDHERTDEARTDDYQRDDKIEIRLQASY